MNLDERRSTSSSLTIQHRHQSAPQALYNETTSTTSYKGSKRGCAYYLYLRVKNDITQ